MTKRAPRAAARPHPQAPAPSGPQPGYYRFPAIHGERIAFCSDDDLWVVGVEGGIARRLTVSKGAVTRPVFSPDGEQIAFAATDEGASEIYVIAAGGGETRRLTFLGAMTFPVAWSRDGREIIFASDAGQAFINDHHLCAIPPTGGPHRRLPLGPARAISFQPDGPGVAIARNGGDPARWKRYRGGTVGTLWVDRAGDGAFTQILKSIEGNLASPMWIGGRIYFLSDHEGIANLYSVRPDGRGARRRHTHHEEFYARFPTTDGRRIVYHAGADLHLYDLAAGESRRLPVEVHSSRSQRQRKFIAGGTLEDYDPHPDGHSLLLTVRGRSLAMGLWEGPATEFGTPWRGRHRLARWLNDGKRFVALTDEEGEEQLEIVTPGEKSARIDVGADIGRVLIMEVAPPPPSPEEPAGTRKKKGKKAAKKTPRPKPAPDVIAITNHRQELFVIDLTAKRTRRIDHSPSDRIAGISWSPDARWLAYGFSVGRRNREIRIADAQTGTSRAVTSGDFIDFAPCFDPEGKYLYFLSLRTYDPVYDLIQFGLGFPRGVRPYLVTLTEDETSPFLPAPRPLGPAKPGKSLGSNPWEVAAEPGKEGASGGAAEQEEPKGPRKVAIDWEGIERRVLAIPVPEGRYRRVAAIPGKIFFLADPIAGSLGQTWALGTPAAKSSIEVYDLRELKSATFVSGVTDFVICRDRKTLVYRTGARLRALAATGEPGKAPADENPGRASGWIDLERVRCSVDPTTEWRQMLAETWRLQRDQFWVADMSRVDWQRVYQRYAPLVERVSTRGELSDLIWEMQGELGTSHAYELGGDYRHPPSYPVGFLGADLACDPETEAWTVTRIPQGDPWDPNQTSPLGVPGLRIRPGTRIHAVNGIPVGRDRSPHECLVHRAGQEVWLTISDPQPAGKGGRKKGTGRRRAAARRTVTTRTLGAEYALRYRDWVEGNRAWVHAQSAGRIGYVHIPNMGPLGYSEFHRYFLAELDRDGLIIDVRYNGGGHVSQLLLEKLMRKRAGYDVPRHMALEPYPSESPRGPMVALTNELAGSDGDIFSHCWKIYGLGPLIGKRTWGGVIGIWPRHALVDDTITTQPEFSFWFKDVGWAVENYGTDPDIEVDIRPQDYAAGVDPPLARGLKEVQRLSRRYREALPDLRDRPSRALPRLPGRRPDARGDRTRR
ncbi:MAG: PDZ domain-containing protein [Candidatus Eisenbacteria sp.]|nr:PDZ domain-containing protein [Candidatus Eisenbacteria bacterium]